MSTSFPVHPVKFHDAYNGDTHFDGEAKGTKDERGKSTFLELRSFEYEAAQELLGQEVYSSTIKTDEYGIIRLCVDHRDACFVITALLRGLALAGDPVAKEMAVAYTQILRKHEAARAAEPAGGP